MVSKFDCWSEREGRVKKLELGPSFPVAEGVGGTYLSMNVCFMGTSCLKCKERSSLRDFLGVHFEDLKFRLEYELVTLQGGGCKLCLSFP